MRWFSFSVKCFVTSVSWLGRQLELCSFSLVGSFFFGLANVCASATIFYFVDYTIVLKFFLPVFVLKQFPDVES